MGRLRIVVAADGLSAEVHVAEGAPCTEVDLRAQLAQAGVVHGLDDDAIAQLALSLAQPKWIAQATVARGTPPIAGDDGRLMVLGPPGLRPGREHADGHIDYRERQCLLPVTADVCVATLVEPGAGRPGRSVLGRTLPSKPGAPLRVRIGPGLRQAGDRLFSLRGGALVLVPPLVDVVPFYEHSGDVDYESGNLHSDGAIAVRGDVREGFTVDATADVHVTGAVLDAIVTAGGKAIVDQGVLGGHAAVTAGTDLHCRHATGALLRAQGTLTFGDQASHCLLHASRVVATSGRGTIFGGELRAKDAIVVRNAGTAVGSPTTFVVGDVADDEAELIRQAITDLKVADRAVQRGRNEPGRGAKVARDFVRATNPAQQAMIRLRLLQRERLRTAVVEIHDTLHAGVRIHFGERTFASDVPRQRLRLCWDEPNDRIVEENLP
jgi:uncharacterized protein (DUF342 family)